MDINNKKELIAELEKLWDALIESERLHDYIEGGFLREAQKEILEKKSRIGTLDRIPTVFYNLPEFFYYDINKLNEEKSGFEKLKKKFFTIIGITGITLVLFFLTHIDLFNYISVAGIFASIIFGLSYFNSNKDIIKKESEYAELVNKYNASIGKFSNALHNYEAEKSLGIQAAKEYGEKYKNYYRESEEILNQHIEKCNAATKQGIALLEYILSTNEFFDGSYHYLLPNVISILKTGRSDTLGDALNLALQDERQAQLDAQRQAEEEKRTAIMQQQLEDQRRHNMEMERQAAAQVAIAKQQEAAARDAARQQKAQERSNYIQGSVRCKQCENWLICGHTGNLQCGAFKPKK